MIFNFQFCMKKKQFALRHVAPNNNYQKIKNDFDFENYVKTFSIKYFQPGPSSVVATGAVVVALSLAPVVVIAMSASGISCIMRRAVVIRASVAACIFKILN